LRAIYKVAILLVAQLSPIISFTGLRFTFNNRSVLNE